MLAGLLFANAAADDRPDRLIATLPFAGSTLIEHQARQLVAAGASQLVVIADRLTPGLLGALSRAGRTVTVDTVRSAAEAAEKLHPLARVIVIADGLVATDEAVVAMAGEGGDALLVVPIDEAPKDWERVGGRLAWAGISRVQAARVGDVARLPRDYNMQSTLLRVAEQAGAVHIRLPSRALDRGHGLAAGERELAVRRRGLMASLMAGRRNWFDRFILAPIASVALPKLVEQGVSGKMTSIVTGVVAVMGVIALAKGFGATGALLAFSTTLVALIGTTLASLRGEAGAMAVQRTAGTAVPLVSMICLGWIARDSLSDSAPLVTAISLVLFALLGERAVRDRASWWGAPASYLLVVLLFDLLGEAAWGLGIASLYAATTLSAAIERLRVQA